MDTTQRAAFIASLSTAELLAELAKRLQGLEGLVPDDPDDEARCQTCRQVVGPHEHYWSDCHCRICGIGIPDSR